LEDPDPLVRVEKAIRQAGYGGDCRPALLTYLAATSRLLAQRPGSIPCHVLLLGPPSAGKSFTADVVRGLLPSDAIVSIEAGSPRALIYDQADLRHRAVFFGEADSLPAGEDNPAASAIRILMQEGTLHYAVSVPDRTSGTFNVRRIEKPGPTAVITTATRPLGAQLMSRFIVAQLHHDQHRLQAALEAQARLEIDGASPVDEGLVSFQRYLQTLAPITVVVPFAPALAFLFGTVPAGPRVLRDYSRVLSLVKAVAICRITHRERDDRGRIVATIDDYRAVYEVADEFLAGSSDTVGEPVREVVAALRALRPRLGTGVAITNDDVARLLDVHKSTASRRIATAIDGGWVVNRARHRGRPADLTVGDRLSPLVGLPAPEILQACAEPPVSSATEQPAATPSRPAGID